MKISNLGIAVILAASMIVMFACSGTQNKNENYYAKVLTLNPDDRQPMDEGVTLKITELAPDKFRLRVCDKDGDILFVTWVSLQSEKFTFNNKAFKDRFNMLDTYIAPIVYIYTGEAVQFNQKDKSVATTIVTSKRLEDYVARKTVRIEEQDGCGKCIYVENCSVNKPDQGCQLTYLFPLNQ